MEDGGSILRALLALVFVSGLIGLLGYALRRFDVEKWMRPRVRSNSRLGLEDTLTIDGKRRLVLLRRDDVMHLVLLGANEDTVIETGIPAAGSKSNG